MRTDFSQALRVLAHPGRTAQVARWIEDVQAHALLTTWRHEDPDAQWSHLETMLGDVGLDEAQIWSRFYPLWSARAFPTAQIWAFYDTLWTQPLEASRQALDALHEVEPWDVQAMYGELLWAVLSETPGLLEQMLTGHSPWPVPPHVTTFDLWYNRAMAQVDAQQWEHARVLMLRTLSLRPGLVEGWHQLGHILGQLGHEDARLDALEAAMQGYNVWARVHDDEAFWHYWRASVHAMLGRSRAALKGIERAAELEPVYAKEALSEPDFASIRAQVVALFERSEP